MKKNIKKKNCDFPYVPNTRKYFLGNPFSGKQFPTKNILRQNKQSQNVKSTNIIWGKQKIG